MPVTVTEHISEANAVKEHTPFPFSRAENTVVNNCQLKPQPNLILSDLDFQTSTT